MAEQKEKKQSLVVRTGERYGVDSDKLLATLKHTAFRQKGGEITNEQMMALLVVCEKYDLNPFINQIYAYPDKRGGIVPVVGVDGWLGIMNRHPQYAGSEYQYSDKIVESEEHKPCPEWCEITIYRKDRDRPIVVREYLDEVYRPPFVKDDGTVIPGPWQTHTKRMLRHKTTNQGGRMAFGLSGIYDEDEAQRVLEAQEQAIEAEIVPEIEDVEGKFKNFLGEAGLSDMDSVDLVKYLDESCTVSGLTGEELMKNLVVAFTADEKEIGKFVESFRAWQEKNTPVTEGAPPSDGKRELIAEIDQMIEALDDPGMAEEVLAKYKLKIGNMAVGNVEELEAVKREINRLIDKQTSMFKR